MLVFVFVCIGEYVGLNGWVIHGLVKVKLLPFSRGCLACALYRCICVGGLVEVRCFGAGSSGCSGDGSSDCDF